MRKVLSILLSVFLGTTAFLAVAQAQEMMVSKGVAQEASNQALSYWTKERVINAKPHPMGAVGKAVTGAPIEGKSPLEGGGAVPGSPGGKSVLLSNDSNDTLALTGAFEATDVINEGLELLGYSYPPPHTTFDVPTTLYGTTSSAYPYRVVGKIFFTKSDGLNYVCSGSSIGGRAVLTAGHCVSDGKGKFHTNWVFVPAYRNNVRPYGTWSASWKTTFTAWHNSSDFGRDVGFAAVYDQYGKKLSQRVGTLGFAWNQSTTKHWNMLGYPGQSPYNGAWLVQTQASLSRVDASKSPGRPGIGTKQTPGCSGGPWILDFISSNYANGVNSSYYTASPLEMFSPYFDTAVNNMRVTAIAK
ncbi:MAG: serine protease [Syntrophobacteraceae bacterium]